MKIPVLMYHSISNDNGHLSVSPKSFDEQISYLFNLGYKSIKFNQINEINKKPIIITFDDGYKDNLIHALPILKKYNFTSTCFVVSDYIGEYNKWDINQREFLKKELLNKHDISEWIKYGMSIGSHSKSHRSLSKLIENDLNDEISSSKNDIQDMIGNDIEAFSYPYGHLNKLSVSKVKDTYKFAVTTIRSRYDTSKHKTFFIPRIHMSNNLSKFKFFFKLKTIYEDIKYNDKQLYL